MEVLIMSFHFLFSFFIVFYMSFEWNRGKNIVSMGKKVASNSVADLA